MKLEKEGAQLALLYIDIKSTRKKTDEFCQFHVMKQLHVIRIQKIK